jgi:iron complex outermembrane receptor protein
MSVFVSHLHAYKNSGHDNPLSAFENGVPWVSSTVLLCVGALLATIQVQAADVSADDSAELGKVVVTARNREEIAQDVPIPVTVIGGKALDRDATVNLQDLVKKAPGLQATTPNSRRTGISIRGIGKSAGNDALEASMGVIVDNVYLTHPGMTYQDYTDLDRVEVLRGPQGTLLGKNTTIGALNYVSRAPSFTPQGSANLAIGSFNARTANASFSNVIVDTLLAYRASFFLDKQDGFIKNVNPEGGTTNEKNRSGGRVQALLTPNENFSAKFNFDYAQTNERSNTKPVIKVLANYDDAANSPRVTSPTGDIAAQNKAKNTYTSLFNRAYFGGYQPIVGSWDTEDLNLNVPLLTTNQGASAELNWTLGELQLTSITAARGYVFDAKNDQDQTKFDVARSGTHLDAGQQSQEFRVTSTVNRKLDYQAGLFYLHGWNTSTGRTLYGVDAGAYYAKNGDYGQLYASAAGRELLQAALRNVYSTTVITPETKSYAAFGQVNWHPLDNATLTLGLRDTYEHKTNSSTKSSTLYDGSALADLSALGTSLGATATDIASAINVRAGQVGNSYPRVEGIPIKTSALSWLVSPSYQLNKNVLLFLSAASGQKSGSVQFDSGGNPLNVKPEKVFDLELGAKTLLLNRRLMLNANLYQTIVKDYQQTTSVFDPVTTATNGGSQLYYSSVLGNIPRIRARGVELDGIYNIVKNLSVSFGASYNDAIYTDWHTATCPSELNVASSTTVCDNTGKQVVAAPKFVGSVGVDYQQPIGAGYVGHIWGSNAYRTKQNFDNNLSRYGVQEAYSVTDVGFGIVGARGKIELDLLVKNAFNIQYTTSINVGSDGTIGYDGMGEPRMISLVLHAKL